MTHFETTLQKSLFRACVKNLIQNFINMIPLKLSDQSGNVLVSVNLDKQ